MERVYPPPLLVALPQAQSRSAPRITTPKQQFGKNIGDDYFLVNWTKWVEYLQKLDRESDRMTVLEIGAVEIDTMTADRLRGVQ